MKKEIKEFNQQVFDRIQKEEKVVLYFITAIKKNNITIFNGVLSNKWNEFPKNLKEGIVNQLKKDLMNLEKW